MGSVWRAEHVELSTPAAVKLIDPTIATRADALARFKREAQAAATLRSPHVVQILDYGVDQDIPYIAMELLEGESLAQRLERQGRLTPEVTATILTHVARAVGKAHEIDVIHRDLKPDNIFLVPYEDEELAKVLDFGIAKQRETGSLGGPETRTGALLGTPFYMSPEQASGRKEVDHRTDIWAMAVIAFECLTGQLPFADETLGGLVLAICTEPPPVPSSVAPVPAGFDQWFARGTAKDPDDRFQSAREQAAELCELVGSGARRSALPSASDEVVRTAVHPEVAPMPAYPGGAPATTPGMAPEPGTTGDGKLGSTGTLAPPSSVTVGAFVKKPRTGMLVGGAALAALVVGGVALVVTGRFDEAPAAGMVSADPSALGAQSAPSAVEEPESGAPDPASSASAEAEPVNAADASSAVPSSKPPQPPAKAVAPIAPARRVQTAPPKSTTAPPPAAQPTPRPPRDTRSRLDSDLGL
jgi:hypothetical protein